MCRPDQIATPNKCVFGIRRVFRFPKESIYTSESSAHLNYIGDRTLYLYTQYTRICCGAVASAGATTTSSANTNSGSSSPAATIMLTDMTPSAAGQFYGAQLPAMGMNIANIGGGINHHHHHHHIPKPTVAVSAVSQYSRNIRILSSKISSI